MFTDILSRLRSFLPFQSKTDNFTKIPSIVHIISRFDDIDQLYLDELKVKYSIKSIKSLELNESGKFTANKTLSESEYPDLIILCDHKLEFYLEEPEILYKAEIVHSRLPFSSRLFHSAIRHYSEAVINSGK